METRKLRTDGTTETALTAIAQMGMVTRRALATMLFYLTQKGEMERYTSNPVALSRAIERLKSIGYISEVPYDGKKYLAATTLGKDYCHKYELPTSELLTGLSVDNAGHRKAIVANSDAITVARSMRVLALPAEKPEFAEFATLLGALTVFNNYKKGYTKEELLEDLNTGICYSKLEMREAYNNSSISGMRNNSSQRVGITFKPTEVTVLYQMEKKTDAVFTRGEVEFDYIIKNDLEQFYRQNGGYHTRAYILVPTMNYLPTFFHGSVDGIEAKNEFIRPANTLEDGLAKFKIDKLPLYGKIYMLPVGERYVDYREAVDNYTDADYEHDKAEFEKNNNLQMQVFLTIQELIHLLLMVHL